MLRQIALTAGTRLGLTVFGLVTSIVTARFLGQSGRGDYFFIVTLAALIVQFANLGLPSSNTYFAARDPERTPQLVANALWISLGVGGGLGVGIALFAHAVGMLQDTPASYLWLAAALAPPTLSTCSSRSSSWGAGRSGHSTRWSSPSGWCSCRPSSRPACSARARPGSSPSPSPSGSPPASSPSRWSDATRTFRSRRASSSSSPDFDTQRRLI